MDERADDKTALREPYLIQWRDDSEMKERPLHMDLDLEFVEDEEVDLNDVRQAFIAITDNAVRVDDNQEKKPEIASV